MPSGYQTLFIRPCILLYTLGIILIIIKNRFIELTRIELLVHARAEDFNVHFCASTLRSRHPCGSKGRSKVKEVLRGGKGLI